MRGFCDTYLLYFMLWGACDLVPVWFGEDCPYLLTRAQGSERRRYDTTYQRGKEIGGSLRAWCLMMMGTIR